MPDVLARHELGVEHLQARADRRRPGSRSSEIATFQDALVRNKQRQDLYSRQAGAGQLHRPEAVSDHAAAFPANVPPGIYQVQVFELEDGQVGDAQRSALVISKIGVEADVFDFAQQRGAALRLAGDRVVRDPGLAGRGDLSKGVSHG